MYKCQPLVTFKLIHVTIINSKIIHSLVRSIPNIIFDSSVSVKFNGETQVQDRFSSQTQFSKEKQCLGEREGLTKKITQK